MADLPEIRERVARYFNRAQRQSKLRFWPTVYSLGVLSCQAALNTALHGPEVVEEALKTIPKTPGDTLRRRKG